MTMNTTILEHVLLLEEVQEHLSRIAGGRVPFGSLHADDGDGLGMKSLV